MHAFRIVIKLDSFGAAADFGGGHKGNLDKTRRGTRGPDRRVTAVRQANIFEKYLFFSNEGGTPQLLEPLARGALRVEQQSVKVIIYKGSYVCNDSENLT